MTQNHPVTQRRLFRSTSIVSGMTMLSRIVGLLRDVVLAQVFGAGSGLDAFVIAFKLPNFLRRLFGEGAFAQAFVPILTEFRARGSHEQTRAFVSRIVGTLGAVVFLLVLLVELMTPVIVFIFAPGFVRDPVRYHLAVHMIRIIFPYLLCITLVSLAGSIFNTFHRFTIPALTPLLLNIALIAAAWYGAPYYASQPVLVLGWGVLLGGLVQLLLQWPYLKRMGLLPVPRLDFSDPGVRRVMRRMLPALFGVSVAQLGFFIDTCFASLLPVGSISWLYFSDRLIYLPLGVIAVAVATVMLPHLSQDHHDATTARYSATLDWGLRMVVVLGIPAAVGLFVLAGPLLSTLIQYGKFGAWDVIMTRKSVMAFAIGLPGAMLVKVLATAFYAQHDIRTPVKVAAVALVLNVLFILVLIHSLAHAGLALASAIASLFNAACLLVLLLKQKRYIPAPHWLRLLSQVTIATALMAVFIMVVPAPYQHWLLWPMWSRFEHLFFFVMVGIAIYCTSLWLLGVKMGHLKIQQTDD